MVACGKGDPASDIIVCTTDVKVCPDGTWVGRTGPMCEFACPVSINK